MSRHSRPRAHAKRGYWCSCGKVVYGNGAKAMHAAMHQRKEDDHIYITRLQFDALYPNWESGQANGLTQT